MFCAWHPSLLHASKAGEIVVWGPLSFSCSTGPMYFVFRCCGLTGLAGWLLALGEVVKLYMAKNIRQTAWCIVLPSSFLLYSLTRVRVGLVPLVSSGRRLPHASLVGQKCWRTK